ncbi:MAG: hypothetical protein M1834_005333 [Cirrosporium novae-zelandiae]|nr:MAG: hypothetical protein M1834_005333 [Cirrosporium novae-zelandiae]
MGSSIDEAHARNNADDKNVSVQTNDLTLTASSPVHNTPENVSGYGSMNHGEPHTIEEIEEVKKGRFAYLKTWDFYLVVLLGQFLTLCQTGTNTFTSLLAEEGTSMPAFQSFFNYVFLSLIYVSYTIYRYKFKGYGKLIWKDGWKYIILSFCDVEGNYFTVLAYRYTTILSCQLINFWAIVVVCAISFLFLKVRYHPWQIGGIFVCIAGMGILLASDHITGSNGGDISSGDQLKGDLFALVGATFYGLSNTAEEFLVSKRPMYEVIGQMGMWGMIINGVQAAIFDRGSIRNAVWNGAVGGYLTGYTLCLAIFYSGAPILFRLSSAAFFNISLLTGNFWGVVIGLKVFNYHIHWMYPIAFTLIMVGHFVYYLGKKVWGEAKKPWLGRNQEKGISGVGTAKRKVERPNDIISRVV